MGKGQLYWLKSDVYPPRLSLLGRSVRFFFWLNTKVTSSSVHPRHSFFLLYFTFYRWNLLVISSPLLLFSTALTYSNKQSMQFVQSIHTSLIGTHLLSNATKLLISQAYSNSFSYSWPYAKTDIESMDIIKRLWSIGSIKWSILKDNSSRPVMDTCKEEVYLLTIWETNIDIFTILSV